MSTLAPVQINQSRRFMVKAFGGSVLFVIVGIFLVVAGSKRDDPSAVLIGLLSVVFFGGGCLLVLRRRRQPPLVIDDRGLRGDISSLTTVFIPWEQATGFYPLTFRLAGSKFDLACVVWADETWVWKQMTPGARRTARVNLGMGIPLGAVNTARMAMTGAELAALLTEQRLMRRPDLAPWSGPPGASV